MKVWKWTVLIFSLTGCSNTGELKKVDLAIPPQEHTENTPKPHAKQENAGVNAIKHYINALRKNDIASAARQLMYPENISAAEKNEKLNNLIKKIKKTQAILGKLSSINTRPPPIGNYKVYYISMIHAKKSPPINVFIDISVVFSKAKEGMIKFLIGEIDGQFGLYEVQYWCFTCVKPGKNKKNSGGGSI